MDNLCGRHKKGDDKKVHLSTLDINYFTRFMCNRFMYSRNVVDVLIKRIFFKGTWGESIIKDNFSIVEYLKINIIGIYFEP